MDTSNLMPGYVHQGFCKARMDVAELCAKSEDRIGKYARIPAKIIDESLIWVEWPIRTIEDVALIAINSVGSIFSKGCRENLKYSFICLERDNVRTIGLGLVIILPLFLKCYLILEIAIAALQPFDKQCQKVFDSIDIPFIKDFFNSEKNNIHYDPKVQYKINEDKFNEVSATRKHGYSNIRDIERIISKLNPEYRNKIRKNFSFGNLVGADTNDIDELVRDSIKPKSLEITSLRVLLKNWTTDLEKSKKELTDELNALQNEIVKLLKNKKD